MLLALAFLHLIVPLAENAVPRIAEARLDGSVMVFAIALALLTTILFSFAPALRLVRASVSSSIRGGALNIVSGRHDRLRNWLVIAQIALGLVLLSAAGLVVSSFLYVERRSPGFTLDHLLTFNIDIPSDLSRNTSKQAGFSHELLGRLSVLPGVRSVATSMPLPLSGDRMSISFDIEERRRPPSERPSSDIAIVTPSFFQTMGIALLQGRRFTDRDDASAAPVLIVNKAFADRFFPGERVIGKRIESGATASASSSHFSEIVGVVENARQSALGLTADPIYYFPYRQMPWGIGSIVLRTSVPPLAVASAVRNSVRSFNRQIPVFDMQTMEHFSENTIAEPRMHVLLMGSFAVIALLLTAVGLYGVLAYSVLKRTREIGVRISLGASRGMIVGMVLRQALLMIAFGMVLGLGGSIVGGQAIKSILYGVNPLSPGVLTAVCSLLAAVGMLAAYVPAHRAGSIDPMQVLRSE